jgi:recombination protein RecA
MTSNAKQQVLKDAIATIEKQFGKWAIMRMGDNANMGQISTFHSGSYVMDLILGWGYPEGRVIEMYGHESSGKTTIALHAIAEVQKRGEIAAFIDAEHALDPHYARKLWVDVDNLLLSQPDYGEQALQIAEELAKTGAVKLIVIDSVSAMVPRAEVEWDMGDSHMGLQARMMSQGLRKITGILAKTGTSLIFINQIRMKIGVMFGNPETTSGGNALKFFASQRLEIRKWDKLIGSDKEQEGYVCKIKTAKNKIFAPFKTVEVPIRWAQGISKPDDIVEASVILKLISRNGAFYALGDQKFQGKAKLVEFIMTDDKARTALETQIQSKIKDMRSGKQVLDEDSLDMLTEDMHASPSIDDDILDIE